MKLTTGEILKSCSGRELSPAPKIDITTYKRAINTMRRVDTWLVAEARKEADSYEDKSWGQYVMLSLPRPKDRLSTADRQMCNDILFGYERRLEI